MSKQRTSIEYDETNKRLRAVMEQSCVSFRISDVPDAINCLLDMLGGRGINVFKMVRDLLICKTAERYESQKQIGAYLGTSQRAINYHVLHGKALDSDKILEWYRQGERKQLQAQQEAMDLQKYFSEE